MSLKSVLTTNIVSETLTKVVSLLSSASLNMSVEQINALVLAKMEQNPVLFAENNDIGFCVSRLVTNCLHKGILNDSELTSQYKEVRDDVLVSETINELATNIARNISPIIYELRKTLPQETHILVAKINEQIPAIEAAFNPDEEVKVFNWGKLGDATFCGTTILAAQDKLPCFKLGAVRQHDASNILRNLPLNKVETLSLPAIFKLTLMQSLDVAMENEIERGQLQPYVEQALHTICNEKLFNQTINNFKDALSNTTTLSANLVDIVTKLDAVESVLQKINADMMAKTEIGAAMSTKVFNNIEIMLTNIMLLRASMIYHKIHTMRGKLILAPNVIQESELATFREAGGTDQMIKNHFLYMALNTTQKIPNNGLSADVVLNTSVKAHSVVQKNIDHIKAIIASQKARNLQNALTYSLDIHYQKAVESGRYAKTLELKHDLQRNKALSSLPKRSVEDIALEYLVTMQDNEFTTGFYKAINQELIQLVKNQTEITPTLISEATCSGIIAVLYNTLLTHFAQPKKAA